MLFQSKQVSCLRECWPTGILPLWSDHRLHHAIKGEFLSVYKQVLTGNNRFGRLDQIHDLWGDLPQFETFFPHSALLKMLPMPKFCTQVLHIHANWHKASWNYTWEDQGGCFSCRHMRVSHPLSELLRIWATRWVSEAEFTARLLLGIRIDSVEVWRFHVRYELCCVLRPFLVSVLKVLHRFLVLWKSECRV